MQNPTDLKKYLLPKSLDFLTFPFKKVLATTEYKKVGFTLFRIPNITTLVKYLNHPIVFKLVNVKKLISNDKIKQKNLSGQIEKKLLYRAYLLQSYIKGTNKCTKLWYGMTFYFDMLITSETKKSFFSIWPHVEKNLNTESL